MPQGFGLEMLDAPRQSYTDDFWTWANSAMLGSNEREYRTVAGNELERDAILYDPQRTFAGETPWVASDGTTTAELPSGSNVIMTQQQPAASSNLLWWALIGVSVFLLARS